jgi:pimeloyl-ACP methyl ester carboxylesterase
LVILSNFFFFFFLCSRLSKDEVLDQIMIYWTTGSITSSMRLYYETMHSSLLPEGSPYVNTPTAYASFRREIFNGPPQWVSYHYNLKRYSRFEKGGHFAALEEPLLLANDLIQFAKFLTTKEQPKPLDSEL